MFQQYVLVSNIQKNKNKKKKKPNAAAERRDITICCNNPQGSTLLINKTSLNATVNTGQSQTFSVSVTNQGTSTKTVTPNSLGQPDDGLQLHRHGQPQLLVTDLHRRRGQYRFLTRCTRSARPAAAT